MRSGNKIESKKVKRDATFFSEKTNGVPSRDREKSNQENIVFFDNFNAQAPIDISSIEEKIIIPKKYHDQYLKNRCLVKSPIIVAIEENISTTTDDIYEKGKQMNASFTQAYQKILDMDSALFASDKAKCLSIYKRHYAKYKEIWSRFYLDKKHFNIDKVNYHILALHEQYPEMTYPRIKEAALLMADGCVFTNGVPSLAEITDVLEMVTFRHNQILKIEQSLNEVQQLMIDTTALVDKQGDTVDNIGEIVKTAKDNTGEAVEILAETRRNKPSW